MLSNPTRGALGLTLALTISLPAVAGGFQVQQQGAKASGRGNAFVSQADDASATYYNPAAVGHLDGWNIYLGAAMNSFSDTTLVGDDGVSSAMQDVTDYLGNFYVTGPLGDRYAIAVGSWKPFSLRTNWESGATARSALETTWTSRELNANIIANINSEWSVALGIEWVKFDVEQFSSAYDMTRLEPFLFPPPEPLAATRNFALSGDKAGVNVAVHYKGESGRNFGVSFRSKKIIRATGRLYWEDVSEATFIAAANVINDAGCAFDPMFCPMGAAFTDSPAETTIVLPWTVQIGYGREGQGKWDWEVDIQVTAWEVQSTIDISVAELNGITSGLAFIPTTEDFNQTDSWSDSFSIFSGADYHINDSHTVRFGLALDQSPVEEDLTRPYNPDSDKLGLTAGYGWNSSGGHIQVDVYGQYWSYLDATAVDQPNNRVVGGTYETSVISLGASFQYTF